MGLLALFAVRRRHRHTRCAAISNWIASIARLQGRVLDFTHNHGADNRIWSPALQQKRDMYVYVPPGFDPCKQYPFVLWLHGHSQDEFVFLRDVIVPLDRAIAAGQLPPVLIAAPDGSVERQGLLVHQPAVSSSTARRAALKIT